MQYTIQSLFQWYVLLLFLDGYCFSAYRQAMWNAVHPSLLFIDMSAPCIVRCFITFRCDFEQASIKGVLKVSPFGCANRIVYDIICAYQSALLRLLTLAFCEIKYSTQSMCPKWAAWWRAVLPSKFWYSMACNFDSIAIFNSSNFPFLALMVR